MSEHAPRVSKTVHMDRWARELGLHCEPVRMGDGWTLYVFSTEREGQLFAARGWREAEAFVAGYTLRREASNGNV